MNPILPKDLFIGDVEARVMSDGRLYMYGSYDVPGSGAWCSHLYHVYSTDDPAMAQWTDHGVAFQNTPDHTELPWAPDAALYAPDCICRNGKYYLYYCGSHDDEGVAVSDRPYGPFADAKPIAGADGDGIDPTVFVDDDGQAYYLWGQFSLRGAKLNDDMCTLEPGSIRKGILTEQEHGVHEGASMRKINGRYYIVYTDISRGRATCMSYAVSDRPLGPYKKGGVIIDNTYCDPETWNDHGSLAEFHGRWYVFYHRSSRNSKYNRRVCAEPVTIHEDGSIDEVPMTSQGAGGPIPVCQTIDASSACRVKGNAWIDVDETSAEPNEVVASPGPAPWGSSWAEYKYIDLGSGVSAVTVRARGEGTVSFKTEGSDEPFASVAIDAKDGFGFFTAPVTETPTGVRTIWAVFQGTGLILDSFSFSPRQ